MEKVRFEAFNVEELRVLRRACYEAGAAFGDPGHTAAELETLDDLAVEILGELKKKEAAAARQKQEEPLEKTVAKAAEDSLKDVVVGKLPFAPKVFQSPAPPKERVVQRPDIPAKAKPRRPPKAPTGPRSCPQRQSLPVSCMCAARSAARNAASVQKRLFLRATAGSAAGKRSSKICAGSRSGASAAALTATTRTSRMPHLICLA